jgi:DtxR family Mn-dependent transcriptional regulator
MYRLNESHNPPSVSALAKRFNVRLPTAIEILGNLQAKGLVVKRPWGLPQLSRKGMTMAETIMHQHRLVELYLNTTLGLDSEKACTEAAKNDYLLDGEVIDKMCKVLRRPSQCLHGYLIQHGDH